MTELQRGRVPTWLQILASKRVLRDLSRLVKMPTLSRLSTFIGRAVCGETGPRPGQCPASRGVRVPTTRSDGPSRLAMRPSRRRAGRRPGRARAGRPGDIAANRSVAGMSRATPNWSERVGVRGIARSGARTVAIRPAPACQDDGVVHRRARGNPEATHERGSTARLREASAGPERRPSGIGRRTPSGRDRAAGHPRRMRTVDEVADDVGPRPRADLSTDAAGWRSWQICGPRGGSAFLLVRRELRGAP